MVDRLLNMALLGGEPILYLLIGLSFLSVAVVIERCVTYLRNRIDLPDFTSKIVGLLNEGNLDAARKLAESNRSAEAQVAAEGLANFDKSATVASELMDSMTMKQQQRLDKRLTIIGTIGSNAPFAGLLGTVLGIIKAFNDLALNSEGGPSVVMGGIAEALVATAIGLLVAIPAVVFFNYFKNRQKGILSNIEQLKKTLLAFIGNESSNDDAAPARKAA
ncbi:MAG: MotA/TolQ/ExbB proton channel family protein [Proteobacteria bacterium]|nr:MotA/TolQ/ExbB proton channel family protein [Pseudomonadota bacterium]